MKRRIAVGSMATCVMMPGVATVSGCGVRMGMEKVEDSRQAMKQGV